MYKTAFIVLVLLGITGLFLAYSFSDKITFLREDSPTEEPTAWIDVSSPKASEINSAKEIVRELKTGDEIKTGQTIELDKNGLATIRFADGSLLRLEPNTKITLDEAVFQRESEKVSIKVTLVAGRVWSKVVSLISPESAWQVKTSNAVATVRGTSFGVEYLAGRARFLGSENNVIVAVLDPKTKEPVEETKTILAEKEMIEVKDEEVSQIAAKPKTLFVDWIPEAIAEGDWVRKNKDADRGINEKLDEFKEETGTEDKARKKLREENLKEFKGVIKERKAPVTPVAEVRPEENETERTEESSLPKTTESVSSSPTGSIVSAKPEKLIVTTTADTKVIVDGTRVSFMATLSFSDGTSRDVTREAVWQAEGQIGSIESPGIFVAKMGEVASELESVSGSVSASWSKDGVSLKAELVPVTIIHFIDDTLERG